MPDRGELLAIVSRIIALLEDEAVRLGAPPDALKAYSESSYGAAVYDAAAAYWKEGSRGNFNTRMNALIKFGLQDAWVAGAKAVGVAPSDFEAADKAEIDGIIAEEKSHVPSLLDFLDGLANNPDGSLAQANYRLNMWANRWKEVYNAALVYFGGKTRLVWRLGNAEHCTTCLALNGIVAWASEWDEAGVHPGSRDLECQGYNCACSLTQTDRRRSPRALSRIMAALG